MGIFISSLTDNQGLAAGIGIAAILFNYYSVSLSEYVSSTAFGSLVALEAAARGPDRITRLALVGVASPMKVSPALLENSQHAPMKDSA